MRKLAATIDQWVAFAIRWILTASVIAMGALVILQIVSRRLPVLQITGSEEIVELCFAWIVFLGALGHCREMTLFRVTEVIDLFSVRVRSASRNIAELLVLFFAIAFAVSGWDFATDTMQRTPILQLPMQVFYIAMPIAGAGMCVYVAIHLVQMLRGKRPLHAAEEQISLF